MHSDLKTLRLHRHTLILYNQRETLKHMEREREKHIFRVRLVYLSRERACVCLTSLLNEFCNYLFRERAEFTPSPLEPESSSSPWAITNESRGSKTHLRALGRASRHRGAVMSRGKHRVTEQCMMGVLAAVSTAGNNRANYGQNVSNKRLKNELERVALRTTHNYRLPASWLTN